MPGCHQIAKTVGQRFASALLPRLFWKNPTTRVPQAGLELEINCFQFYAIAILDKTSLKHS